MIYTSSKENIKNEFGRLGLYLVSKAEEEIKKINEQTLNQKSLIKKNYQKRNEDNFSRMRKNFIEIYNQFLINTLSSNILKSKEMFLQIKNDLLEDLQAKLINQITENIDKNYLNYIKFHNKKLAEINSKLEGISEFEIILNSRDYNHFKKNSNQIKEILKSQKFTLKEAQETFIGGFKIVIPENNISFDFSINNLINLNSDYIEKQFSTLYSDVDLESFQKRFETIVYNKKQEIEAHLKKYDEV